MINGTVGKRRADQNQIDRLAQKLVDLVAIFRRGGPATDFHWWHRGLLFDPRDGYQDGREIFEAVVQDALDLNPDMLSRHEVERKLTYDFLMLQAVVPTRAEHLDGEGLIEEAKNLFIELIEFEAWQDIDLPIGNLWIKEGPVELGHVTFMELTGQELEQWKKKYNPMLWSQPAHVFARVKSPGDMGKAISYAKNQINLVFSVFRAACFPFGRYSDTWQVDLLGEISSLHSTPMRIDNSEFGATFGSSAFGAAGIELRTHMLSKLSQSQWDLLDKLILKDENYRNAMENKLIEGIHWLSESTKPDTNRAKFIKICFALETLIGGEPTDEDLKVRGITAMLAERAAFIAGVDLGDRINIDKDVRRYYRERSKIVHGGKQDASVDDVDGFGQLVRRVALALLEKLDKPQNELSNVEQLEKWVKSQRYSLPEV